MSAPRHQLNALSPLQSFSPLTAPSTSPNPRGGPLGLNLGAISSLQGTVTGGGLTSSPAIASALHRDSVFHARTPSASETGGEGRRARASSVTSKLSRRDSLIARGEGGRDLKSGDGGESGLALTGLPSPSWNSRGDDARTPNGGQSGGLISRLMLVKAPTRNKESQEDGEEGLKGWVAGAVRNLLANHFKLMKIFNSLQAHQIEW